MAGRRKSIRVVAAPRCPTLRRRGGTAVGSITRWASVFASAVCLSLAPFYPADAQPQNLNAAVKAASCNACHGRGGDSIAGIPRLAGRNATELYEKLIAFKKGNRPAYVMHQHARGYSDEELREIATEFSRQSVDRPKW